MSRSNFAIVCEALADKATASGFANNLLSSRLNATTEQLDARRFWQGLDIGDGFLAWKSVPVLAKENRIKSHGHFDGCPGAHDAFAARRVLLLFRARATLPAAILLIRDDDGVSERRRGLEQARSSIKLTIPVVVGVATTKRECWVLAGFDPLDKEEEKLLGNARKELGFSPIEKAHKLTAKHDRDKKSAKRILTLLTRGKPEREALCWESSKIEDLFKRGEESGLKSYLEEIRDKVLPLFAGGKASG